MFLGLVILIVCLMACPGSCWAPGPCHSYCVPDGSSWTILGPSALSLFLSTSWPALDHGGPLGLVILIVCLMAFPGHVEPLNLVILIVCLMACLAPIRFLGPIVLVWASLC